MQNIFYKICLFFFVLAGFQLQPVYSQTHTDQLFFADSLFKKGNYLESLHVYDQLLKNQQQYSPQMLLKMAYTEEALNHFTTSMYYLNLYYQLHPNRAVLKKMDEVAQANGLIGYKYKDADFFITQFKKYYSKVLEILLIVAVIVVTLMVLKPGKLIFKSAAFRISFLIYLAFIFIYTNLLGFNRKGIIAKPQVALMAGPSAGNTWLATLSPGNRLTITGEEDIWYEVKWQNKKAYVRKNNLLLLPQ